MVWPEQSPIGKKGQPHDCPFLCRYRFFVSAQPHRWSPGLSASARTARRSARAILETGDAPACAVVVSRERVALGRPLGDAHGEDDEHHEHDDRGAVGSLLLGFAGDGIREQSGRGNPENGRHQQTHDHHLLRLVEKLLIHKIEFAVARWT